MSILVVCKSLSLNQIKTVSAICLFYKLLKASIVIIKIIWFFIKEQNENKLVLVCVNMGHSKTLF